MELLNRLGSRFTEASKYASKAVLSHPVGRVGLAAVISGGAVASLGENSSASGRDISTCVAPGWTYDTVRNGIDETALTVTVQESCRPGLSRVEARIGPAFAQPGEKPVGSGPSASDIKISLSDDGLGADKQKGDFTYTSALRKIVLDQFWGVNGVQGLEGINPLPAMGIALVYKDGTERTVKTVGLHVLEATATPGSITPYSESMQFGRRVINVRDDNLAIAQQIRDVNGTEDLFGLVRAVYNVDPTSDPYHFLILTGNRQIFTTDRRNEGYSGTAKPIRTDFKGSYNPEDSDPALARLFGSQGELRHMAFVAEPNDMRHYIHELLHWRVGLNPILGLGDGVHQYHYTSLGGILGGTLWVPNADGSFNSLGFSEKTMGKFEQALMGWIRSEDVPPVYIALNQNQPFGSEGARINGPFKTVTFADVINAQGVPTPGPETTLRHFDTGYVFVTQGRLATPWEMKAREMIAETLETSWREASEGQSTLRFIVPKPIDNQPVVAKVLHPVEGEVLKDMTVPLDFGPMRPGSQLHAQLVPEDLDGPGVNMVISDPKVMQAGHWEIPAPDVYKRESMIALPGGHYRWRIRLALVANPDHNNDQHWTEWVHRDFQTPATSSDIITPRSESKGGTVTTQTHAIEWDTSDPSVYYWEVQVSGDTRFDPNPDTATSFVWWNLVHGGVKEPVNSWRTPQLEPGKTYYWRVRPRIQAGGDKVAWGSIYSFRTPDRFTTLSNATSIVPPVLNLDMVRPAEYIPLDKQIDWQQTHQSSTESLITKATTGEDKPIKISRKYGLPDLTLDFHGADSQWAALGENAVLLNERRKKQPASKPRVAA